jgi:hypothetical protein
MIDNESKTMFRQEQTLIIDNGNNNKQYRIGLRRYSVAFLLRSSQ